MKLVKHKNGTIHLATNSPLLTYDAINKKRIACEFDQGRLFVLTRKDSRTGTVETDVRFKAVEDDPDMARQRELEHLENPVRFLRHAPEEINEVYLGRYYVASLSSLFALGDNTLVEARTELVPAPIPRFDWDTSCDGQEMLELAKEAWLDERKIASAASACARLTIHLTRNVPQPQLALEAVETWSHSACDDDDMERAILENIPGRNDKLCELHQRDEAFRYAADAASCDPSNVVANVALAAAADFIDQAREMDYATMRKCQSHIQHVMRSACANIIRKIIRIVDYPALAMVIEQRNSALCRAPICDFNQWQTEATLAS